MALATIFNKKNHSAGLAVMAFALAIFASLVFSQITHAATFEVTNTNADGPGSLIQAVADANATPDRDTISFNISGAGPHVITPNDELHIDGGPVTIDGCTQPGSDCTQVPLTLRIQVSGANMPDGTNTRGVLTFTLDTDTSITRGLSITDGALSSRRGIAFIRTATGSGLHTPGDMVFQSNYIGLAPDGTAASNSGGITLGSVQHDQTNISDNNIIGGNAPHLGNVISGNLGRGIVAKGNPFPFNLRPMENLTIQNNYVGLDPTGTQARPNTGDGIDVSVLSEAVFDSNRIAHNGGHGINFGNRTDGSVISNNEISDNGLNGINLNGVVTETDPLSIVGNTITGQTENGISATNSDSVQVGGTSAGQGNTISDNTLAGVAVGASDADTSSDITVRGNGIFNNGGLGIDLASDGVTANDDQDADDGPNSLLNYPLITAAYEGSLIVEGTYEGSPNQTFTLDFYMSETADPSGNGEGQTWVGSGQVTTDATGATAFNFTFDVNVPEGWHISATATDAGGNTSEFSGDLEFPTMPENSEGELAATGQNQPLLTMFASMLLFASAAIIFRHELVSVAGRAAKAKL